MVEFSYLSLDEMNRFGRQLHVVLLDEENCELCDEAERTGGVAKFPVGKDMFRAFKGWDMGYLNAQAEVRKVFFLMCMC